MKPIIIFIILFPVVLCLLGYIGHLNDPHRSEVPNRQTYEAWIRTYRYPLTYDQWLELKEKNLLPTQAAPHLPPN